MELKLLEWNRPQASAEAKRAAIEAFDEKIQGWTMRELRAAMEMRMGRGPGVTQGLTSDEIRAGLVNEIERRTRSQGMEFKVINFVPVEGERTEEKAKRELEAKFDESIAKVPWNTLKAQRDYMVDNPDLNPLPDTLTNGEKIERIDAEGERRRHREVERFLHWFLNPQRKLPDPSTSDTDKLFFFVGTYFRDSAKDGEPYELLQRWEALALPEAHRRYAKWETARLLSHLQKIDTAELEKVIVERVSSDYTAIDADTLVKMVRGELERRDAPKRAAEALKRRQQEMRFLAWFEKTPLPNHWTSEPQAFDEYITDYFYRSAKYGVPYKALSLDRALRLPEVRERRDQWQAARLTETEKAKFEADYDVTDVEALERKLR